MKDLLLIENTNSLKLTNKDFSFTSSNSEYVAQKLRITLSFFLGEWYLNTNFGLPYFESIFIKNPNVGFIEDLFKTQIANVDGVQEISSFDLTFDKANRRLDLDFTVITTEGEEISISL